MINKEELMQKLLSKFDNIFREEINSDGNTKFIMIQSEHNNTIYTFSSIKAGIEESYVIFQGKQAIFSACLGTSFSLGDYEFGKDLKEKLIKQYDKQRKEKMPFYDEMDNLTLTIQMLEE